MNTEIMRELGAIKSTVVDTMARHARRLDGVEATLKAPIGSTHGGGVGGQTPGAAIVNELHKSGAIEMFRKGGRARIELTTPLHGLAIATKTLIDSTALGFATPGVIGSGRIPGIAPLARRRLTMRDILISRPTDFGQVEVIRPTAITNNASPQVEANDKQESAMEFEAAFERCRTIAHWVPVTRQALDDLQELQRFVEEELLYGLKLKEEVQILSGDDTGENLNGLTTQASTYAGTYAVAGDTRLDKLRRAKTELEATDENPDFCVLNPVDMGFIETIKEDQGSNVGKYVVGDPLGGILEARTLWGMLAISTNSMSAGSFLVGSSRQAEIRDRQAATIELSESHHDYFTKNKVAIRCEERVALLVYRPAAFLLGTF